MEVKCRNKVFDIFSEVDALSLGIRYTGDWRGAKKGSWILTADKKVLQVLGVRKLNAKTKKPIYAIRTGYGETPTYKHNIYGAKCKDYHKDVYLKGKLTRKVSSTALQTAFLNYLVEYCEPDQKGMWLASDLIQAYMMTYQDNNPNQALQRALWILKKDTSKEFMSMAMKDKLETVGVDDEYVAEKLKDFIEDKNAPHSVRLQALGKASELLGHNKVTKKEDSSEQVMILGDNEKKLLNKDKKDFAQSLKVKN